MTRTQRLWLGLGLPALALAVVAGAVIAGTAHEAKPVLFAVLFPIVALSFVGSGLVAWTRRPDNGTGRLLVAVGYAWFIGVLYEVDEPWLYTIGVSFGALFLVAFAHLLLAYPSGRLETPFQRRLIAALYPLGIGVGLVPALFDRRPTGGCDRCPDSAFLIAQSDDAVRAWDLFTSAVGLLVFVGVGVTLFRRWHGATPMGRRQLAPVYFGGAVTVVLLGVGIGLGSLSGTAGDIVSAAGFTGFGLTPFLFLSGLLQSRLQRERALLEVLPDLMIRSRRDGTYLEIHGNLSALSRPREQLLGRTIWEVLPEERARPLQECVERTLETGEVQSIEYQLELGGELRDFEARMVPSGEDEVVAIVREFTERRRLQRELQERVIEVEREQEFTRTVVDTAPGIFVTIDPDGRITRFNTTTERLLGYPTDDSMKGRYYWDLFLPEPGQRQEAKRILERLRAGEPLVENETTWRGRDGREAVIFACYTPILDGQGEQQYLICGLDVTERVRQQEELRASRARLVEAADQARRRLERNLHDGAQQRLVSLSLALRLAQARLGSDPESAGEILAGASSELALALEELRELARGLHPAILTDRGLGPALESVAGRAPVPVELELACDARLPDPVEAAAFYVVSESLANVAKYAQASHARVRVARDNGHAVVEVADDGVGGADPARGSGLRGLLDRVEALDGRLELESRPGQGTQIRAFIPLR